MPPTTPAAPASDGSPRPALLALAVALITFALFAPAAENGFVRYDDDLYLTENETVRQGLSPQGVRWAMTSAHASNWHPLTWLSHMLDVQLFGLEPGPHHLMGAGLHALNAALLFLVLVLASGARWPALFAALLFALHPLRVESVVWASERKDLLAGLFWMLGLLAWTAYVRRPGPRRYLTVLLLLALGLMAKPMLVSFPVLLLALDFWPLKRVGGAASMRRLVLEKLPLFFPVLASAALTTWAQTKSGALRSFEALPLDARLSNALVASVGYVGRTIWPAGLSPFYPHPAIVTREAYEPFAAHALGAGLLIAAASVAAFRARRNHGYWTLAWAWIVVTLLPVIGIVQVGEQSHADRYTYLPMIGLAIAVAFGGARLTARRPALRRVALVGAVACLALYARATLAQIRVWHDTTSLFEHALRVTEHNYVAHTNLGLELVHLGQPDAAADHYEAALRIRPDDPKLLYDLGLAELRRGRLQAAEELFRRTTEALPGLPDAHTNLGIVLARSGRPREAIAPLQRALRLAPLDALMHANLATALAAAGELEQALRAQTRALELALDTEKDEQRARLDALEAQLARERGS